MVRLVVEASQDSSLLVNSSGDSFHQEQSGGEETGHGGVVAADFNTPIDGRGRPHEDMRMEQRAYSEAELSPTMQARALESCEHSNAQVFERVSTLPRYVFGRVALA